jgi:hypothetical protein
VVFDEDDSWLIASIKGTPTDSGFLAVWDVAGDGSLSANLTTVAPSTGGALPFGMNLILGTNAILATDPAEGSKFVNLSSVCGEVNPRTYPMACLALATSLARGRCPGHRPVRRRATST